MPRSVPAEYDKFSDQPGILRCSCGWYSRLQSCTLREMGKRVNQATGKGCFVIENNVMASMQLCIWADLESCDPWSWPGWERGNVLPLNPVYHLQELFISSPFFYKRTPQQGAVPRPERCRISTLTPHLPFNSLMKETGVSLSSAAWLSGPDWVWDSDFSFLRVMFWTSPYSIMSCWFLQFAKIISNFKCWSDPPKCLQPFQAWCHLWIL